MNMSSYVFSKPVLLFFICFAWLLPANAVYPERPIRIVLGSGPGGLADVTTRLIAQKLSDRLGQPVVVENRSGAGGITAAQSVLSAPADGYSLFIMVTGNTIAHSLLKLVPINVEKDFTPITSVAFFDILVLVKGDSNIKNLNDLRTLAASKPGGINIGTTNTGSVQNLSAHLFSSVTGIKSSVIPYKTSGEIFIGLVRGDIDAGFDAYTSMKAGVDSGQVRPIVSSGATRAVARPQVATMKEMGFQTYEVIGWNSIFAVAGTPPSVIQLLNRHIVEILALPDVKQRFLELGAEAQSGTPQEMANLLKSDLDKWANVIKKANIEKQ